MTHVTRHAVSRYRERVADVTEQQAEAALSCPAIMAAIEIGAPCVRLGTGHRAIIEGGFVVTVIPPESKPAFGRRMINRARNQ
jgi:hypothetical protein